MTSALTQIIPQESREEWAIAFLLVLSIGLLSLIIFLWMITRHRMQRMKRGDRSSSNASDSDAWSESARRLSSYEDPTDEQDDEFH